MRRYYVLGGGSVTTEFYLPALRRMGLDGAATVVEPEGPSLAAVRKAAGDANVVAQDFASFLEQLPAAEPGRLESVIICLPNQLHVAAARTALGKGRDVLCEKPLALVAADCAGLGSLAAEKRCILKVAMSRRYMPSHLLARQIVAAGELGRVRAIRVEDCVPFLWRPRSFSFFARESGGVLADMGVHYLDFLDTLVGPLSPVDYEDDARGGTESSARYELKAGSGEHQVSISVKLSRLADAGKHMEIECERGSIRIDKTNEQDLVVKPDGGGRRVVRLDEPFENSAWPKEFHGSFCQMLADFDRACDGQSTMIADVSDAERAAGLIEWAYANRSPSSASGVARASDEPDRILVTGATGFIGGHLVDRLTAQGHTVRASVRSPSSCANLARYAVEMTPTDLLDPAAARKAVDGQRTVYHLAYGQEGKSAPRITIDGTKNIVQAAIAAGVESVVVLSTMYVFGFPKGERAVDESFPYAPYGGEYGESKAEMERWCLEVARSSGRTRIAILNPTCVFGPRGGAYTALPVDMARKGQFCWVDGGDGYCNYTYVENVVDAMIAAAHSQRAHGERFIVNDGTTTWRAFFEPMLAPLGLAIPSYTPQDVARLPRFGGPFRVRDLVGAALSAPEVRTVAKRSATVRSFFDMKQKVLPTPPIGAGTYTVLALPVPYPPEWIASLYSPARATFSAAKAERVLGWMPAVGLEEAQGRTISWLVESGRLPGPKSLMASLV